MPLKEGEPPLLWPAPPAAPAPAATPANARFRLRVEMGLANPRELLGGTQPIVIGSADDASLVLHDPGASARHCTITVENDQVILRDLGSRTGTWLGGVRVREVVLGGRA